MLIEGLIGAALLAIVFSGVLGTFLVARYSGSHGRHRMNAMNIAKQYIEQERQWKFYESAVYRTIGSATPVDILVEEVTYTVTPLTPAVTVISTGEGGVNLKTIGFEVSWWENLPGGQRIQYKEKLASYVADH